MTEYPFDEVDSVFQMTKLVKIIRHRLSFPAFQEFSAMLNKLCFNLGDLCEDEYWLKIILPFKRTRFEMCATPRRIRERYAHLQEISDRAESHLKYISKLYPDYETLTRALLKTLRNLIEQIDDPLLAKLNNFVGSVKNTALVIKSSSLIISQRRL
jgi:hypothetical protein